MTKAMRKAASEAITKRAKARAADLTPTIAELQTAGATSSRSIAAGLMSAAFPLPAGLGAGLRRRSCACWHGAKAKAFWQSHRRLGELEILAHLAPAIGLYRHDRPSRFKARRPRIKLAQPFCSGSMRNSTPSRRIAMCQPVAPIWRSMRAYVSH